jgi:hypothetical protein
MYKLGANDNTSLQFMRHKHQLLFRKKEKKKWGALLGWHIKIWEKTLKEVNVLLAQELYFS